MVGVPCVTYALIGKTGHGKSTTANSLTRSSHFVSSDDLDSVTDSVAYLTYRDAKGRCTRVIDTPGVFDTKLTIPELAACLAEFTHISPEGLDAVVCIVRKGRMTDEELSALSLMETLFGPSVWHHAIIVFTHCRGPIAKLKERISKLPEGHLLRTIIEKAKGRVAKIDNAGDERSRQDDSATIHDMISQVVAETGNKYDNKCFEMAREKMREVEAEMNKVRAKYESDIKQLKVDFNKGILTQAEYKEKVAQIQKLQEEYESKKNSLELEHLKRSYETWDALKDWGMKAGLIVATAAATGAICFVAAPYILGAGLGTLAAGGGYSLLSAGSESSARATAEQQRAIREAEEAEVARLQRERLERERRPECAIS